MANKKLFNSKNIVNLIETLVNAGKVDLVMQILETSELKNLLPNITEILKRKNLKIEDYKQTKVYSKTEIKDKVLQEIGEVLKIDTRGSKIIIDENMSAGVKIKSKDRLLDASLSTMLERGLDELLAKS